MIMTPSRLMISICASSLLMWSAMTASDGDHTLPPPDGWVVYSHNQPAESALLCANHSNRNWIVAVDGERLRIKSSRRPPHGGPRIMPFNDGTLVGRDQGEFGGGLWWITRESKVELSDDNVLGFVDTPFGMLALTGLDHLSLHSGQVLRLSPSSPPDVVVLADLGQAPYAFVKDAHGSVIVVTGSRLIRIDAPGDVRTLFNSVYGLLIPNSVAVSTSGTLYVGMRHFVTRLTPVGASYRQEWLVPADCAKFELRGFDCVCLNA
jgi:hypothetical protein